MSLPGDLVMPKGEKDSAGKSIRGANINLLAFVSLTVFLVGNRCQRWYFWQLRHAVGLAVAKSRREWRLSSTTGLSYASLVLAQQLSCELRQWMVLLYRGAA